MRMYQTLLFLLILFLVGCNEETYMTKDEAWTRAVLLIKEEKNSSLKWNDYEFMLIIPYKSIKGVHEIVPLRIIFPNVDIYLTDDLYPVGIVFNSEDLIGSNYSPKEVIKTLEYLKKIFKERMRSGKSIYETIEIDLPLLYGRTPEFHWYDYKTFSILEEWVNKN